MTRWIVTLFVGEKKICEAWLYTCSTRADVGRDEIDDVLHRRAGQEHSPDAHFTQLRDVDVRNDPADDHQHVVHSFFPEQFHQSRADVHVGPRENRQADRIGIFLQRRRQHLLGGLAQPGVDDLHAGVAQRPGDDLGAAVVAVEARLGDDHPDLPHIEGTSSYSPHSSRSASHISPTVA